MKRGIIRGFWGLHEKDKNFSLEMSKFSFHRREHAPLYPDMSKELSRVWACIDAELNRGLTFPYTTYVFGEEYLNLFKSLGIKCELINKNPYVHHPYYESHCHKFDIFKYAMEVDGYDEIIFLDWDCHLINEFDEDDIWNLLGKKGDFQACLQYYKRHRVDYRGSSEEKGYEGLEANGMIPNSGFVYLRDYRYAEEMFKFISTGKPVRAYADGVLAKWLDHMHNGWIGAERYWELHEPLCARLRRKFDIYRNKKNVLEEAKGMKTYFYHNLSMCRGETRNEHLRKVALNGGLTNKKILPVMRSRKGLYGLQQLLDYIKVEDLVMVEIGCFTGESTEVFCSSDKVKMLYAVDPWESGYDTNDTASEVDMKQVEKEFDDRLSEFSNYEKIKLTGLDASQKFDDNSLDVVYIDGCHTYECVKEDITTWLPKVKKGGYLCGHDYFRPRLNKHVKTAVDSLLGEPDQVFVDGSWVVKK